MFKEKSNLTLLYGDEEKVVDNGCYCKRLYSIFDEKSETFTAPFVARNDKDGSRILTDMLIYGGDNLMARHPEDYILYCLGDFDIRTGKILGYELIKRIVSCSELLEVYKKVLAKKEILYTPPKADDDVTDESPVTVS